MNWRILFLAIVLAFIVPGALAANFSIDSVNYNPSPAEPGKTIDLYITLTNTGSDAEKVVFELDLMNAEKTSTFPFTFTGDQKAKQSVGTLKSGKSALLKYSILIDPNAISTSYAINMKFGENNAFEKSSSYSITVSGKKPEIELITSEKNTGVPGEMVETELLLKNTGNSEAVDVLVGIEEDRTVTSTGVVVERQIRPVGVNFLYIPKLLPGEEKTVVLRLSIDPSAEIKTYSVPLTIKWLDADATGFSKTRYIGIKVGAEPEIDAIISDIKPTAFPGGTPQIEVSIFNAGKAQASNIVIEVESEAVAEFDQKKQFIGTLESDDSDVFKVKAKILPTAELGEHALNIKIYYKKSDSEETILTTIPLTFKVSRPTSGDGTSTLLIVVVVVVVVGYWYYNRRRKKRREKR